EILLLYARDAIKEFFHEVLHNARQIGFENSNVVIMFGMLGETQENWQDVIQQLVNLGPESIAIYKMELFFNTKLFNEVRSKKHEGRVMTDNDEIEFIRYAHKRLKEEGYVVGNCLHLLKDRKYDHTHIMGVWNSEDMRAFGITSHSCCDEFFFQNTPNLDEYHRMLSENKLPIKRSHRLSIKDKLSQAMVYGMKRVRINRKDFCSRYGYDVTEIYGEKINQLVDQGILAMDEEELRITDDYQIFADDIARQFFLPEYASMMPAHLKRK
ncbi:MAG: hypothetical protein GY765_30270, partial [bacterium]|nr:hypothetical protein [bacterium]